MTVEKYLNSEPDVLEKITDAEMQEYFKSCLHITRPELAPAPTSTKRSTAPTNTKKDKANDILKQLGIDLKI